MPNTKTFSVETLFSFPKRLVFLRESGSERKSEVPKTPEAQRKDVLDKTSEQLGKTMESNDDYFRRTLNLPPNATSEEIFKALRQRNQDALNKELARALAEKSISQEEFNALSKSKLNPLETHANLSRLERSNQESAIDKDYASGKITKAQYEQRIAGIIEEWEDAPMREILGIKKPEEEKKELKQKLPKALREGAISQRQLAILSDPKLDVYLASKILADRRDLKEDLDAQLKKGELTQADYKKEMNAFLAENPVEEYLSN